MHTTLAAPRPLAKGRSRKKRNPNSPPWGWLEWFVIIQFLSPGLLFIPGAQGARFLIRALPYISSVFLLFYFTWGKPKTERPPPTAWILGVMVLLVVGIFHPGTKISAGIAQWVFQLSIVAPLFWVGRAIDGIPRLERLIKLVFLANAASAVLGILQVIMPAVFLPGEFSRLGLELSPAMLDQSVGAFFLGGREIIRPPGLSDLPGGAAVASAITVILGTAYGLRPRGSLAWRFLCIVLAGIGLITLFFTLVRSLAIMAVLSLIVMLFLVARQGQIGVSIRMLVIAVGLVVGVGFAASSFGGQFYGESLFDRFSVILADGLFNSWMTNRGFFVDQTFTEFLPKYPLGGGMGRWGMMEVYFGDETRMLYPPIHVEIQLTGWLLDGGILMWILYGGAIASAMVYILRWATSRSRSRIAYAAGMMFCIQLLIVGTAWAGPAFNTQLGILFWTLVGGLHGTDVWLRKQQKARRARAQSQASPGGLTPGSQPV